MKVSVIGTGYVGLVTGVCLSSKGHDVICYDNNKEIVKTLNEGIPTFHENGLKEILTKSIKSKSFKVELVSEKTHFNSELIMVAVGTPSKNGKIDLSYIKTISKLLGSVIKKNEKFISVIIKSTVIPGTTDTFVKDIIEKESGKKLGEFGLGMNPEFLREGAAIEDAMNPDRIVFGYEDKKTLELLRELYSFWDCEKIEVNSRTAEMIKYANNSLLAIQISAVNELANITDAIGNIDFSDVYDGFSSDKRWSPILDNGKRVIPDILKYLVPGCGFGGSCFPKDVEALQALGDNLNANSILLRSVLEINRKQPQQIITLLKKGVSTKLNNKNILILGLAFKPDTDDVRESVAIKVITSLIEEDVILYAHDPIAIKNMKAVLPVRKNLKYVEYWVDTVAKVDAIIVLTKWSDYKILSSSSLSESVKGKTIIDPRRLFKPEEFLNSKYLTIGRSFN